MTTTADHTARDRAALDELQHRIRAARIYAHVMANDPDDTVSATARKFLDYLEPTQAEPVGDTATEYRIESWTYPDAWDRTSGRWGYLRGPITTAESAEHVMEEYRQMGFHGLRLLSRQVTAWTTVIESKPADDSPTGEV